MNRKKKEQFISAGIYLCAGTCMAMLCLILGFIIYKGLPGFHPSFLIKEFDSKTTYVTTDLNPATSMGERQAGYIQRLGVFVEKEEAGLFITEIDSSSSLLRTQNQQGDRYALKKGDSIRKISNRSIKKEWESGRSLEDVIEEIQEIPSATLSMKVFRPGGGIFPMLVTTLFLIILCLVIAVPIGVCAAIFLQEYAKPGKMTRTIHFAIESLSGIPSIIYGLFGSLLFVKTWKMQYSILAGALTVSIMLLPMIITTTEETLKTVPKGYRESSLGLGATKFQTICKVVLPSAIPGILVSVLLSIGKIVGESAALLLTAGTVAEIPRKLIGSGAGGATLTIKAYTLMKEENDIGKACTIGIVLLFLIIFVNLLSKWITNQYIRKRGV